LFSINVYYTVTLNYLEQIYSRTMGHRMTDDSRIVKFTYEGPVNHYKLRLKRLWDSSGIKLSAN